MSTVKINIPWLESSLFENVLNEKVGRYKRILNFNVQPATGVGENYTTVVLRVKIEIELLDENECSASFILKVVPDNPIYKDIIEQMRMFEKEKGMYTTIVPLFEQMYRDQQIEVNFSPKYYPLTSPSGEDCILLEDLCERGFKNINRLDGLDVEHTKCALRKLAQWHAASAVHVETHGEFVSLYADGIYDESQKEFIEQTRTAMSAPMLSCLKNYKGHEIYEADVRKLESNVTQLFFKSAKLDRSNFNVLNHGDCWSNNIMFQHNEDGSVKKTYFLDYQMPMYGSPAQDLYNLLLSSTKLEIKVEKFDYFIKYYHDCLVDALILLKYPKRVPTLKSLHCELLNYGIWGYATVTGPMAAVLSDPNDRFRTRLYNNSRYCKHFETLLPWLHNRGALER